MDSDKSLLPISHLTESAPKVLLAPLNFGTDPVYVSAKRYHRILKRRAARNKAKVEMRKTVLHPSRSALAKRRPRNAHGKFAPGEDGTSSDS